MSEFKYSLKQFSYNNEQIRRINQIANFLNHQAEVLNCPNLFTDFNPNMLNSIPILQLELLGNYKKILLALEDVHFKTIKSIEYKNIELLLKCIPEKLDFYKTTLPLIEDTFRSRFSEVSSESLIFETLFSYSEFREQFMNLINKETLTINQLIDLKSQDVFELCRQKILEQKFLQETSLQEGVVINLASLKNNPKLYNLLASEFFYQFNQASLGINNFSGKHSLCELIRPSHLLAEKFNLSVHEAALLSVSLNPIPKVDLKAKDRMTYFDLSFELYDEGEAYKLDIIWPLQLNRKNYLIQAEVFFYHLRLQLINGQRSADWRKHG